MSCSDSLETAICCGIFFDLTAETIPIGPPNLIAPAEGNYVQSSGCQGNQCSLFFRNLCRLLPLVFRIIWQAHKMLQVSEHLLAARREEPLVFDFDARKALQSMHMQPKVAIR